MRTDAGLGQTDSSVVCVRFPLPSGCVRTLRGGAVALALVDRPNLHEEDTFLRRSGTVFPSREGFGENSEYA